ncbi:MAG: hypothetical protein QG622_1113 [Actinomycetota bacterium]|nr:hypothetical protein [Actinomycetota bacterium]
MSSRPPGENAGPVDDQVDDRARDRAPDVSGAARRDVVTVAGYTAMAMWAWFLYGFGAILPLLREEQGTTRTVLGLHSLALAAGGLVAGFANVTVVRRLQRRGALRLAGSLVAVGVVALLIAPAPALSVPACLVAGAGGSMMLNSVAPALAEHHAPRSAAFLSEGNAVAAGVGLVAPLAVGAALSLGWSWRPAMLVMGVLLVAFAVALRRVPARTTAVDTGPPPRGTRDGRLPAVFWTYLVMLMACIAMEFCCTAWSADLLRQRAGLPEAGASAGVTAVVAGMAVGRLVIGRLAHRYSPRLLLAYALALSLAGWLVVWPSTRPAVMLAGLVVVGLGLAGHYPLGVALSFASVPGRTDAASSRNSLGISAASGVAPFALGTVADATSTHLGFLVVPAMIIVASTALIVAVRLDDRAGGSASGRTPPAEPRLPPGPTG